MNSRNPTNLRQAAGTAVSQPLGKTQGEPCLTQLVYKSRLPIETLLLTPRFSGVNTPSGDTNRSSGLSRFVETAEAVQVLKHRAFTPLKRGVNESGLIRSRPSVATLSCCGALWLLLLTPAWAVERQSLSGHVPAAAARLQPNRRLPASSRLNLAIGLPLRNQEALTTFLDQLYAPASPQYRHYLSPEQFPA